MNIIEIYLKFGTLSKRNKTEFIALHHAAMDGSVEDIHRVHLNRGYSGIGYHIYIRKDGSVYRGRPIYAIGAHAYGSNSISVGVCFEGNFEIEEMSDAQKQSGKEVVAYLKELYGINVVKGHKQVNATACPGRNFPFDEIAGATEYTQTEDKVIDNDSEKYDADEVLRVVEAGQIHSINFTGHQITVDGKRGTETKKQGIRVLQTGLNLDYKAGLRVDGEKGTLTDSALGYHYVKKGETQYMVTVVRILLMLKGYSVTTMDSPSTFDDDLEYIVKIYQKNNGLTADGVVGRFTFLSLIS